MIQRGISEGISHEVDRRQKEMGERSSDFARIPFHPNIYNSPAISNSFIGENLCKEQ